MKILSGQILVRIVALVALVDFLPRAMSDQPILTIRAQGAFTIDDDGFAVAQLRGTAPGMGKFVSYGELVFAPGDQTGSFDGEGIMAFTAANGDIVAAFVEWQIGADGTNTVLVHWRDAVTFSDSTSVATTGRFVDRRPPGPIYIKITDRGPSTTQ
jgi:hypothetical protein